MWHLELEELRQLSVRGGVAAQQVAEQRLHGQLHGERAVQLVDLARLAQRRLDYVAVVVVALRKEEDEGQYSCEVK